MKQYKLNFTALVVTASFIALSFTQPSSTPQVEYPNYWSSQREYVYSVIYADSAGNKITSEKLTLRPTGKTWVADSKQTLINFQLDSLSADSGKLPVTPLNGKKRTWMKSYEEGVIQTPTKVWMHPLRQNQYILTELAPFPEVVLPLKKDTFWKSTLWIYETFGTFAGTVENSYTLSEQVERSYNFGKLLCWKVEAVGKHNKLGENTATYYFNEEYGFTEMNYHFFNNQKIEITLSQLKK